MKALTRSIEAMALTFPFNAVRRLRGWTSLVGVAAALALAVGTTDAQEVRWPLQNTPANVPAAPEDPTDAKVYATLDRLCASCHQAGKLKGAQAGRGFAHVLDIPRVAADASLVRAGNPDASRLYTLMQIRGGVHEDLDVNATDLEAVRDWIGGTKPAAGCADRKTLTRADDEAAIAAKPPEAPLMIRHLTLKSVYNACASAAEMKAYRHAVTVAVNSLSWALKPVVLPTIDAEETLLRVDLAALGWEPQRWQLLVDAYPFAGPGNSPAASPGTLRADWFVVQALRPPLYYDLLGLPDRLQTLQASLKIDAAADVLQNRARRIGLKTSSVTRGGRLIQRHGFANGGFWTTYEYAPTPGRPDLFDAPGGPGTRGASKPDASLAMFNLPSGYTAFFIANGDGLRMNDLPQSVLRHEGYPSIRVSAGAGCISCHARGVLPATDELRARVQGDTAVPRDIREKVLAMHPGGDEMRRLMDEDSGRLADGLARSGLVPGATLERVDPVVALGQWYERDVSLEVVAAELGIAPAALKGLAGRALGRAGDLVERLVHGPVSRRLLEQAYGELLEALAGRSPADGNATLQLEAERPEGPQLVIRTGAAAAKAGDSLTLRVRTSQPCYLTLINVDRSGRGTVVFPNDFEQNNYLETGKELRIPADGAPYVFRLRDAGRETVIGHCMTVSKSPPGIRHDFERQRFTELGEYRAFLNRTGANEPAQAKAAAAPAPEPKGARRRTTRPPAATTAPQKGEGQARVAVQVEVLP
jgi:hypothetical protein